MPSDAAPRSGCEPLTIGGVDAGFVCHSGSVEGIKRRLGVGHDHEADPADTTEDDHG